MKWRTAFIISRLCVETFLELLVKVSIGSRHVKFADPGIVVYKNVGFGFDVGNDSSVLERCFVWRVGIRRTIQTLDDFPHIWAICIQHCVLKEIFPALCLGLVDSLGGFTASINQLLSVLVDCPMEAILSTDFDLHLWRHPKFRFLARFCFPNVVCCSRDENMVETRYKKRD